MPYVVTSACLDCKDTTCVEVCLVDCFHEDLRMLLIDPDECVDCGACVPVCPVHAIYEESEVPADQQEWIKANAIKAPKLPHIGESKPPLEKCKDLKKH